MMGWCPYCGNRLSAPAGYAQRFCDRCGNPLQVYGQQPPPYQYQTPPPPVVYYIPPGPTLPPVQPPQPPKAKTAFWKGVVVIATIFIILFAVVLAVYELTKGPPSPLEGSWTVYEAELNGEAVAMSGTLKFDGDGSYHMTMTDPIPDTLGGTWDDLGYGRMTIDGETGFYELDGDDLRFGVASDSEGDSWSFNCTRA